MTEKPTILITENPDGQDLMSPEAMSLLFGIPADDIATHIKTRLNGRVNAMVDFPHTWLQAGRRRVSEAAAATGTRELLKILEYWAHRDHNAELILIEGDDDHA